MMQSIALLLVCLIAAAQAFIAAPAAARAETAQNMFGMGKVSDLALPVGATQLEHEPCTHGKPAAKKGGIVITVQQKSFKDFDIELPAAGNLRKALMDKKVDIYPLQGKIYNCGGGGSCGTCAVDVVEGMQNCNPKGPAEKKLLGNKKESIRLSCCTRVTGPVTIKTKP
eukprot:12272-Heterococcus_DN1.PRE.4